MLRYSYYSNKQGSGWVADKYKNMKTARQKLKLAGVEYVPGKSYDMNGHFARPLRYLGVRENADFPIMKEMVFHIGQIGDLHFFQSIYWVSETRIYEHFTPQAGRDFNFKGGKWK